MVDRLPDLKKEPIPQRHYGYDPSPYEKELDEVAQQIDTMTTHVNTLKQIVNNPKKQQEIDSCYEKIDDIKSNVCKKLKQLKLESLGNSADERIKANLFRFTVQKFSTSLQQYDTVQQQLHSTVINEAPIFDKRNPRLTAEFSAISQKHYDIEKIAQSLAELHQMLVDMAVLVNLQGETLDSIEDNVTRAEVATEKATEQLQQADKSNGRYRKQLCCLLIIVMIVLAAIIVPSATLT